MDIQKGFKTAKEITKKFAKTFYFSSKFLPKEKRMAAYSIYAICRLTDDAVDSKGACIDSKAINEIKNKIESVYSSEPVKDNLLLAFKKTVEQYCIPKKYFDELIEGMHMDLKKNSYKNFDELYNYCYRVAGVIGLIMVEIFGYSNKAAEKYSVDLGIAMQLTNILRDIKEDYLRGRIYLPRDEMERFHVSEKHLSKEIVDQNFIKLLKFQIKRAHSYYELAENGIEMICGLRTRFVVCVMKDIYAAILDSIERNRYDVFCRRAHVNIVGKLAIAFKIWITGKFI